MQEFMCGAKIGNIREIGKIIKCMEKEKQSGLMAACIKVNT